MNRNKYYNRIEIVRVLLCLCVLFYHLNIFKGGYLAVGTFFLLSGYFSASSCLKKEHFSLGSYYLSRLKNLYLKLLVFTLGTVLLLSLFPKINWLNLKPEVTSVLLGYNNFWQLGASQDYFARAAISPLTHLWYIAILLQLELVFPLIYLLLNRIPAKSRKGIAPLVLGALAGLSFLLFGLKIQNGEIMQAYYGTFSRAFSFLLGSMMAYIHTALDPLAISKKDTNATVFMIYLLVFLLMNIFWGSSEGQMVLGMFISTVISMRLLDYSVNNPSERKNALWVQALSAISYEIYLVQYPLIYLFERSGISPILSFVPVMLLTLILAVALHLGTTFKKFPPKKAGQLVMCALLLVTSLLGGRRYILEEDHTAEMEELQRKLEENEKMIEERNREYQNTEAQEELTWEETLKKMEDEDAYVTEMLATMPVVGIGDSILLDAVGKLYDHFPNGYFDAKISRRLHTGIDILQGLKDEGKLGEIIIVSLSQNGDYSKTRSEELMALAEDREVFWVDAVGADDPTYNRKFAAFAEGYDNLHIVEWEKASANHPEYFYHDGIHVIGKGVSAYADTIYNKVFEVYKAKFKVMKEEMIAEHEKGISNKTGVYGNGVLLSAYESVSNVIGKAEYTAREDLNLSELYQILSEKKEEAILEKRLVIFVDSEAGVSLDGYQEILDLCKDCEIYLCDLSGTAQALNRSNLHMIDFLSETAAHPEYLSSDGTHLSEAGSAALGQMLAEALKS